MSIKKEEAVLLRTALEVNLYLELRNHIIKPIPYSHELYPPYMYFVTYRIKPSLIYLYFFPLCIFRRYSLGYVL